MNFGRAHKVATYLTVWCSYLALVMSGELSMVVAGLSLVGIVVSWWWEAPRVRVERWQKLWSAVGLAVLGYSVLSFLSGGDLVLIGAELLLFLMVAKLFGRRASRDYQQVYVLSFLMLVAATVLNSEVSFGVFFLGYVVTSTWALILFHLRREIEDNFLVRHGSGASQPVQVARILGSKRIVGPGFFIGTGGISLAVFLGALALFMAIPRIGFGLFFNKNRGSVTLAGFSDGVRLGGHGVIKDDDTVVMRVEVSGPYRGRDAPYLHWRGVAFDRYERGEWKRSRGAPETLKRPVFTRQFTTHHLLYDRASPLSDDDLDASLEDLVAQDVYLEPLGYDVLFGASMPSAFRIDNSFRSARPHHDTNDELRYSHSAGIRYTVFSRTQAPPPDVLRASRQPAPVLPGGYQVYLQMPAEITDRVRKLAAEITRGAPTDYDKAAAVEAWLQGNLSYTLQMVSPPGGQEPIDFFLFDRKMGHCEYFSSAMAILLRAVGVPTRNVNGFLGGEWNEYDDYIAVRAGDAHSWVEVYLGDAGWVTFDPTPSASVDQLGRGGASVLDRLGRMADTIRFKWFKWVIEYDIEQQLAVLKRIGDVFRGGAGKSMSARFGDLRAWVARHRAAVAIALTSVALLVVGIVVIRRRRQRAAGGRPAARRQRDPVAATYLGVLKLLGRRGWPRGGSVTPREHARALAGAGAPGAGELAELTELYYAAEYGGGESSEVARERALALAAAIQQSVKRGAE